MKLLAAIAAFCSLTIAGAGVSEALAQTNQTTDAAVELVSGEIRKIDKTTGKLTIKHGPIKSLDMPPMTMAFHAGDKTALEQVAIGDKIEFSVANENGKMTASSIKRIQP
jgi:Cu(I)/Ag(I) efflux system periplasmic protein CusF